MILTEGDLVVERAIEIREGRSNVIVDTLVRVSTVYPDLQEVVLATPLRRFCYVDGYPEKGRLVPIDREDIGVLVERCRPAM